MKFMYGNNKYGTLAWNTCMEIPPCLVLGRKNPNKSVFFGLFEVCFEVGLFLVECFLVKMVKTDPF